jgi:imidazolonepropionase-like amidohydrolase
MSAMSAATKTLVIRNGTLIDGSGKPSSRNDAIVIEGNKVKSVGALPADIRLEDRKTVDVIDAAGKWIMPGLIDAHCHMSYGYPLIKGEGKGKGTTRPEFSTLKSARSAQKVLRSGVTSISVPGGTWFTDVGVRDAIKLGLMEGPRMFVAGRMIVTYGCIEDDEPSWEGTPDHSIGKLCNTKDEMVTEVRRQGKHGVNFIKMADSRSGESQMLAREEIAGVVGEAHRRNLKVAIHSRGAGSTGSCTPISPPTAISMRSPKPACRFCPPRRSSPWCASSASSKGSAPSKCSSTSTACSAITICSAN